MSSRVEDTSCNSDSVREVHFAAESNRRELSNPVSTRIAIMKPGKMIQRSDVIMKYARRRRTRIITCRRTSTGGIPV